MRRKVLQDHANVFCQMLVGWRMGEDVARLAKLGSGVFTFDILKGTCCFNNTPIEGLYIVGEINAWFISRLKEHKIPKDEIKKAILTAKVVTQVFEKRKNSSVVFDWQCNGLIRTDEVQYEASLSETHRWN